MALIDDFKARFPEFDEAKVDSVLPLLEAEYPCYYGRPYDAACDKAAILFLLAHLFVVNGLNTAQSPIRAQQSKTVGSVSVSNEASTESGGRNYDFFRTTKYGQQYLLLISRHIGGVFV